MTADPHTLDPAGIADEVTAYNGPDGLHLEAGSHAEQEAVIQAVYAP